MKDINHAQFKKLISAVPSTTLEDISILLPDDYFECKLSKKTSKGKLKTMFLGLNRSETDLCRLDLLNMRHPILDLLGNFKNKGFKEKLMGSYLSDFIKYQVLRKFLKKGNYADSGEVCRVVKENPKILEKCGEALLKEIAVFQTGTVFCFGGATYDFTHKYFIRHCQSKLNEINPEMFSVQIDKRFIDFVRLTHYSKRVFRAEERIEKEIREYYSRKK
ncbi:MAG: hypothetical protein WC514_01150 [Candidatus Paceibacterota bacterium]